SRSTGRWSTRRSSPERAGCSRADGAARVGGRARPLRAAAASLRRTQARDVRSVVAPVDEQRAPERDDDRAVLVEPRGPHLDDPDLRPGARRTAREDLGLRVERVALE